MNMKTITFLDKEYEVPAWVQPDKQSALLVPLTSWLGRT